MRLLFFALCCALCFSSCTDDLLNSSLPEITKEESNASETTSRSMPRGPNCRVNPYDIIERGCKIDVKTLILVENCSAFIGMNSGQVQYYSSTDNQFDSGDTPLDILSYGYHSAGSYSFHTVTLEPLHSGYIVAVMDATDTTFEHYCEDDNVRISEYYTVTGTPCSTVCCLEEG